MDRYDDVTISADSVLSPELALVDVALARHARMRLPAPDDTLARLDALIETSRIASLARRSMELPGGRASDVVEATRRIRRVGHRRRTAFAGGIAAGALVFALLLGVRIDLRGSPAGADSTSSDEVPAATVPPASTSEGETVPQPRIDPAPRATGPEPQRFAWAPVPDASGYHVELFRGSSKVFEAETRRPSVTVPARWSFDGRSDSLRPGDYRWYVWPLVSGRRAATAIVQARLVVPAS